MTLDRCTVVSYSKQDRGQANYIESPLSELLHREQDESLSDDIPVYAARIDAVFRNLFRVSDSRLSELLQALEDIATALQQCNDSNTCETNTTPSRIYIYRGAYCSACIQNYT